MLTRIVAALMSIIKSGAAIIPVEANEGTKQMISYETTDLVITKLSTDEIFKIGGKTIANLFRDIDCAAAASDTQALSLKAEIWVTEISPNTGLMPLCLTNIFLSFGVLPDENIQELNKANFEKFISDIKVESTKNEDENTHQKVTIRATAKPVFTGEKGRIIELIDELCIAADFDNPALIKAIVHCESGFNQYAISSCGAEGLMQIMPKYFGKLMSEYGVTDLCVDERGNLRIGIHWMQYLIAKYDGNLSKALVAYNCGESAVDAKGRTSNSYSEKVLNIVGDYM